MAIEASINPTNGCSLKRAISTTKATMASAAKRSWAAWSLIGKKFHHPNFNLQRKGARSGSVRKLPPSQAGVSAHDSPRHEKMTEEAGRPLFQAPKLVLRPKFGKLISVEAGANT